MNITITPEVDYGVVTAPGTVRIQRLLPGPIERIWAYLTDGELRRHIEKGTELRSQNAGQLMHTNPRTIRANALAVDAVALMETHHINSVLVVNDAGALVGALNTHDLMRAKVI